MFNKKLLFIIMFFCIFSFKPANCMRCDGGPVESMSPDKAAAAVLAFTVVIPLSVLIAYNLNNLLCKNDFYREKFNPFLKKVLLLSFGTKLVMNSAAFLLAIAAASSSNRI